MKDVNGTKITDYDFEQLGINCNCVGYTLCKNYSEEEFENRTSTDVPDIYEMIDKAEDRLNDLLSKLKSKILRHENTSWGVSPNTIKGWLNALDKVQERVENNLDVEYWAFRLDTYRNLECRDSSAVDIQPITFGKIPGWEPIYKDEVWVAEPLPNKGFLMAYFGNRVVPMYDTVGYRLLNLSDFLRDPSKKWVMFSSDKVNACNEMKGKYIKCKECGKMFYVDTGSLEYIETKGWKMPVRCKPCREKRKKESANNVRGAS